MITERKTIFPSNNFPDKRQIRDLVNSLIAYKRKVKPKLEKSPINWVTPVFNKNQKTGFNYAARPVNDFNTSPELTSSSFKNDPDLLIREYFIAKPSDRKSLQKYTAKYINSVESVLEILEWSTRNRVQEAYDGAVNILAECSDVVLKVANQKLIDRSPNRGSISAQEEKWEVLIKGLACSQTISAQLRFGMITKILVERNNSRLVKAAIIDALSIMHGEIDTNSIKSHLASFLTSDETDEYIKKSAKEAMEEIL